MARRRGTRDEREARQLLRDYTARQTVHRERLQRRRRDNLLAALAGVVVIALAATAQVLYFTAGPGLATPSPSPTPSASAGAAPDPSVSEYRAWSGQLVLDDVKLGISLDGAAAPQGVAALVSLVQDGYYRGKSCTRITTQDAFAVLQCGAPNPDGSGDAGFRFGPIENAPADGVYPAGTIALARGANDANSQGAQFFIAYDDTTIPPDAAGGYTVVGKITSGLDQLRTAITDQGTADGSADGPPKVPTVITDIAVV